MKEGLRRILVGIKPSQSGLPIAAGHARALAQSLGAELRLVSCVFDSAIALALERSDREAFAAQAGMIDSEREMLESLGQTLSDWGVQVTVQVLWQSPTHEGVLRAVREWGADLLVLGAHEEHPTLHTRLVETDWQLMRLCPVPLLLVKDPHFDGYSQIMAAIDPLHEHAEPSGMDRAILEAARRFAATFRSELRVAHVFPDPEEFALVGGVEVSPGVYYGPENIEALHRRAVIELVAEYGLREDHVDLVAGTAGEVLGQLAREQHAKLLVLGAIRRGQLAQSVLGSTAEAVAAEADCDLLFVPAPAGGD